MHSSYRLHPPLGQVLAFAVDLADDLEEQRVAHQLAQLRGTLVLLLEQPGRRLRRPSSARCRATSGDGRGSAWLSTAPYQAAVKLCTSAGSRSRMWKLQEPPIEPAVPAVAGVATGEHHVAMGQAQRLLQPTRHRGPLGLVSDLVEPVDQQEQVVARQARHSASAGAPLPRGPHRPRPGLASARASRLPGRRAAAAPRTPAPRSWQTEVRGAQPRRGARLDEVLEESGLAAPRVAQHHGPPQPPLEREREHLVEGHVAFRRHLLDLPSDAELLLLLLEHAVLKARAERNVHLVERDRQPDPGLEAGDRQVAGGFP